MKIGSIVVAVAVCATAAWAQHDMPAGMSHEQHRAQMNERGKQAMGFDHEKTAHHFLLRSNGGVIQVQASDAGDASSREQIRTHLWDIARQFAAGDFSSPLLTHAEMPPGADKMRRLKSAITYSYAELPAGAVVRIASRDKAAVKAVHEFLLYQIREHETGDPTTVTH
jgi:hypothetical protein